MKDQLLTNFFHIAHPFHIAHLWPPTLVYLVFLHFNSTLINLYIAFANWENFPKVVDQNF